MKKTLVSQLAELVLDLGQREIPSHVLTRAAVQIMDTMACALGAVDTKPATAVGKVISEKSSGDCTLFFEPRRVRPEDAILYNGTLVRYLDYNDAFLRNGPGGHPSDNIPVAIAVGEREKVAGIDLLQAVVIGYEVFWRLRQGIFKAPGASRALDGVSASGVVAAAISGLLMRFDHETLTHALAIGASHGYTLPQVRRGRISMVKAVANALVARNGVLAADLAANGMTGPSEVLEGDGGLLEALGIESEEGVRSFVMQPLEIWRITEISIKPFPAIGTSQAAIAAAIKLTEGGRYGADEIEKVTVKLPDGIAAREQLASERLLPTSRESADHSVPFLVASALGDGGIQPRTFERDWSLLEGELPILAKIEIVPDPSLVAEGDFTYPAVVEVTLKDGRRLGERINETPGSPLDPWGEAEVSNKFHHLADGRISSEAASVLVDAVTGLVDAPSLDDLSAALSVEAFGTKHASLGSGA